MKTYQTLLLFGLLCLAFRQTSNAQNRIYLVENGFCSYAEEMSDKAEQEYFTLNASEKAEEVKSEILKAAGLSRSNIELKVSNIKNAIATVDQGRRYILYSQQFFSRVDADAQSKWIAYSILAHEIGHHILGHNFQETNPDRRKQMELEADEFSGNILRMLCAGQEDAVAAISTLLDHQVSHNYPPISARKEMIANSWYIKDLDLKRTNRDPCGKTMDLKFGSEFGTMNLAENAKALVKEEEMIVTFDALSKPGKYAYRSYLTSPERSNLTPKNIEWLTDPEKTGNRRQLIWHFAKDGYTRDQVEKQDLLGVAVFEAGKEPRPVTPVGFSVGPVVMGLGVGSMVYGSKLKSDALDLYDNPYAAIRDPNDDVYQGSNLSRTETYNAANKKYRQSQTYRNIGIALISGGVAWGIYKILKHKKSKIGNLYAGEGKVKVNPRIFY